MDRRYYLLKIGVILIAVAVAGLTSETESTRMAHEVNLARYSAPAAVETAAWRTTAYIARTVAWLMGSGASVQR